MKNLKPRRWFSGPDMHEWKMWRETSDESQPFFIWPTVYSVSNEPRETVGIAMRASGFEVRKEIVHPRSTQR